MCSPNVATTPVVCTSGLKTELYPILTPKMSSLALLEAVISSTLTKALYVTGKNYVDGQKQKILYLFLCSGSDKTNFDALF